MIPISLRMDRRHDHPAHDWDRWHLAGPKRLPTNRSVGARRSRDGFDKERGRLVIFGAHPRRRARRSTTCGEWDGTAWHDITPKVVPNHVSSPWFSTNSETDPRLWGKTSWSAHIEGFLVVDGNGWQEVALGGSRTPGLRSKVGAGWRPSMKVCALAAPDRQTTTELSTGEQGCFTSFDWAEGGRTGNVSPACIHQMRAQTRQTRAEISVGAREAPLRWSHRPAPAQAPTHLGEITGKSSRFRSADRKIHLRVETQRARRTPRARRHRATAEYATTTGDQRLRVRHRPKDRAQMPAARACAAVPSNASPRRAKACIDAYASVESFCRKRIGDAAGSAPTTALERARSHAIHRPMVSTRKGPRARHA